jgi:teichuronic acid biosynthesis glycosyltransferase TuaH
MTRLAVRRALRRLGATSVARIVATDLVLFDPKLDERRIFFATDDFVGGAELLGRSAQEAQRIADRFRGARPKVVAISPILADYWRHHECDVAMIPNGCDADRFARTDDAPDPTDVRLTPPIAGFVGQLNDRIDLCLLEAVADTGHSLLLVGPVWHVSEHDRLSRLLARPNVQWVGPKEFHEIPSYLKIVQVGLTPYRDSPFNRASMPLKTLEYLAAGRSVVATDLPSARYLSTPLVSIASTVDAFRELTCELLEAPIDQRLVALRRSFAASHSWAARAREMATVLSDMGAPIQAGV